jgi:NAD(P)-dependent dehydrogenase (short-subunit alcohol dehydrogenase family)
MTFTARFLAATDKLGIDRRVLNISSGAGRSPIEGWSVYGASKAALDMYTKYVKAEQAQQRNPAKIASLAPGVVDTAMQAAIRSTGAAQFPPVERFRRMKKQGMLASPDETARLILDYLERPDFGEREIEDIRNLGSLPRLATPQA